MQICYDVNLARGCASVGKAEVCGSNPVTGKVLKMSTVLNRTKINKKRAGTGPIQNLMCGSIPASKYFAVSFIGQVPAVSLSLSFVR